LEQAAARIPEGAEISVFRLDGSRTSGLLFVIDLEQQALSLISKPREADKSNVRSVRDTEVADTTTTTELLPISDISRIQYRGRGKVRASWVGLGAIAGAAIGAGIGAAAGSDNPDKALSFELSRGEAAVAGAILGAVSGAILGVALSPLFPSTRTLECSDAAATGSR
jgi:hypothetical protein